ncbi:activator of basal transcription 1-like [Scyliorhinus canicula]|uniref:activator of basal transcription 1-like n=1 Tax=Scyliorhinus canicula TaxID=7830 RepID=UPI0018F4805C|nr:activator of basal transcription 1-like [Scyliorhinus canicula]
MPGMQALHRRNFGISWGELVQRFAATCDCLGLVLSIANFPANIQKDETQPDAQASPRAPLPGILYFGFIPPGLRPGHTRKIMSTFGEVGRVFLQEAGERRRRPGTQGSRGKKKGKRQRKSFTKGWVKFQNKAVAKRVAASLHNSPIGTRKRSRFHDDLWNIKYLHRFKWTHLSERLAYEKLVHRQRMRAEVSQAKRETNFFLQNVEKSKGLEKLQEVKKKKGQEWEEKHWHFQQRATETEIQASKAAGLRNKAQELRKVAEHHRKSQSNVTLLAKIFNPSTEQK